jgi:hypothetical protein
VARDQLQLNMLYRVTPPLFRDRVARELPATACLALQPGDVIDAAGRVRPFGAEIGWGETLEAYRANLAAYAGAVQATLPPFDPGSPDACHAALAAHLQARVAAGVPYAEIYAAVGDAVTIRVTGAPRPRRYLVDVAAHAVTEVAAEGEPARAPGLEIEIPASLVATLLAGAYDPFMILYTYRVVFRPRPRPGRLPLGPEQEYLLFLAVMLTLFIDLASPLLAQLEGIGGALCD